ncbi:MAG: DUF3365 domain-containing protein [bacterium]|nr:DUF3365 domain-containing protein [bacterium]
MVTDLSGKLSKHEYTSRFILPESSKKESQPEDEFERQLLKQFQKVGPAKSGDADFAQRMLATSGQYQYYQPVRAEPSCLVVCHASPPGGSGVNVPEVEADPDNGGPSRTPRMKAGDLMAIVRVTIPTSPRQGE